MIKSPYDILGLSRNATKDEIQQAYRNLAKQHHPDRNIGNPNSESMFREVQDAYDILKEPRKKSHFDQNGFSGFESGFNPASESSHTMHDFFSNSNHKGRNIQIRVDVTLEEIATGCEKKVQFTRSSVCSSCKGCGDKSSEMCKSCDGSGYQSVKLQGNFKLQMACQTCRGIGKVVVESCGSCSGSGYCMENEKIDFQVNIPLGATDGMMKINGQGEPSREKKGFPGDLVILVSVVPHEIFQRQNQNLVLDMPCTYSQLYMGFDIEIPTIYKHNIVVKVPARTNSGAQIKIAGKGLPSVRGLGDMFIIPKLDFPRETLDGYDELIKSMSKIDEAHTSKRRQSWIDKIKKYKL